jgi:reductive dehalogenase
MYKYENSAKCYRALSPHRPSQIRQKYAISIGIEMDYTMYETSPSYLENVVTGLNYSQMWIVTTQLAQYIRGIGYPAYVNGNERVLKIPIAIDAGLGELGRNGLLITLQFGSRVRLCSVATSLPLTVDSPIDSGVQKYCEGCATCANMCPAQTITHGTRPSVPNNVSNRCGILWWSVNVGKCLAFWRVNKRNSRTAESV